MLPLERQGYTRQEVIDALHGKYASRTLKFRYDLLDKNDNKIGELDTVESGEVSMASLSAIKRTARFRIKDTGQINWLSDRIQPFVELKMPEIKRKHDDYALEFDGVDDYVKLDSPILFNAAFRIDFELINKNNSATRMFAGGKDGTNIKIGQVSGNFFIRVISSSDNTIPLPPQNTKCTISLIRNNNNIVSLIVNGDKYVLFGGAPQTGESSFQWIGRPPDSGQWFEGVMDNISIGNSEQALYQFREGAGTVAKDSTSNANHGTIHGATWVKNGICVESIPSSWVEFPLGIFLLSSPTRKDEVKSVWRDVEAYDGLLVLKDDKFESRYTVTAGTNYRDAVIDILASAGITKHNIEQTNKVLPNDFDIDPGKEKLYAINELLRQINFNQINVDVYGYYTSSTYRSPAISTAEYVYKDDDLSITYSGMSEELDLFNVYNKWVVVVSNPESEPLVSSYTNDNPDSPTSTVNRGRYLVDHREIDNIADQQSLDAYVQRIAFEASQVYGKVEFETAINPAHDFNDVLQIEYSPLGISGKYAETGWTIPLIAGGKMKHELRRVISI